MARCAAPVCLPWSQSAGQVCARCAQRVPRVWLNGKARCAEGVRPRNSGQHEGKRRVQVGEFDRGRHTGTPPHRSWRDVFSMGGGGRLTFRAGANISDRTGPRMEPICPGPSASRPGRLGGWTKIGKTKTRRPRSLTWGMPNLVKMRPAGEVTVGPKLRDRVRSGRPLRSLATFRAAHYVRRPVGTRCSSLGREWGALAR